MACANIDKPAGLWRPWTTYIQYTYVFAKDIVCKAVVLHLRLHEQVLVSWLLCNNLFHAVSEKVNGQWPRNWSPTLPPQTFARDRVRLNDTCTKPFGWDLGNSSMAESELGNIAIAYNALIHTQASGLLYKSRERLLIRCVAVRRISTGLPAASRPDQNQVPGRRERCRLDSSPEQF